MKNKEDILTLIRFFANSPLEEDSLSLFFDKHLSDVSMTNDLLMAFELFTPQAGIAQYTYPERCIRPVTLFYGANELAFVTIRELEHFDLNWRTTTGTPTSWFVEDQNSRKFSLFPIPDSTTTYTGPIITPLGADYPTTGAAILYAANRNVNIADILAIPLALSTLFHEFSYPSPHENIDFASMSGQLASAFYQLMGVTWNAFI